jgi:hypothetical protein
MRIHVDKIASVTRNLRLGRALTVSSDILLEEGSVIACRVRGEKTTYNQLEDPHGRMSTLHDGDILVGALGHRNALQGYEGVVPLSLAVGEHVNLLNMGGVLGQCLSHNPDVGRPFELEVLGQVQVFPEFQSRAGQPAHIRSGALRGTSLSPNCPVVYVAGTCMNSGKTAAACATIRQLSRAGYRVGACKLTGVSLMRDALAMRDYGAEQALDFTDAGVVSTDAGNAAQVSRVIFSELAAHGVDVIVAETGDGIMGEYGVQAILEDRELMGLCGAFILCANDPVGVAGGVEHLQAAFGIRADLVAGPATDNRVGERFVATLGLPARNARSEPEALGAILLDLVAPKIAAKR